ncbi:MAG: GNAT family N-acetyltransferase [Anaerolineae bacterium]|nr:GNAT family N-acetyltransferase [Anaerolineae bacterium]
MRLAAPADAPGLARLIHEVWTDHNLNPERIARVSLESDHTTVIEESDGEPVGFVHGFTTVARDGILRWEADLLGVHPAHRGRGIARRLIAASVETGRSMGAAMTRALVRVDNAPSLAAFQRCGFTPDETVCELYVSGEIWHLPLAAPPDAHLIAVTTLTYSGVWVEGRVSFDALRCAQAVRTRYGWESAGTVVPEGTFAAESVGYELAGRYRWLRRGL